MKYLILGRGYTGRFLERLITSLGHEVASTSRRANSRLIQFQLEDETTWKNLPLDNDGTFITLALKDATLVNKFLCELAPQLGKIVFVGTTSAFLVRESNQVITENSELETNNPRTLAEKEIIHSGGVRVFSAGIYGPDRSPLSWVKDGRVGFSDNFVNLIHVEDLARILWQAMLLGKPAESYLASDGQPMRWSDIIPQWQLTPGISGLTRSAPHRISRKVDPTRTFKALEVELKYSNVIEGVKSLPS